MKRVTSYDELERLIGEDYLWRSSELGDFLTIAKISPSVNVRSVYRAAHTITYAHWEGFARFCCEKYVLFRSFKKPDYSTLPAGFLIYLNDSYFQSFFSSRFDSKGAALGIEKLKDLLAQKAKHKKPKIDFRGNLKCDNFEEVLYLLGIDVTVPEDYVDFVNLKLVDKRNHIAHGESIFLSMDQMNESISTTREVMSWAKNTILTDAAKFL